jgi:hypothetical protein
MAVHPTPDRKVKCSSHLVSIIFFATASPCRFPFHGILSPQLHCLQKWLVRRGHDQASGTVTVTVFLMRVCEN